RNAAGAGQRGGDHHHSCPEARRRALGETAARAGGTVARLSTYQRLKRLATPALSRCQKSSIGLEDADIAGLRSMCSTCLNPAGISKSAGSRGPLSSCVTRISFSTSDCFLDPSGSAYVLFVVVTEARAKPVSGSPTVTNSGLSIGWFLPAACR